MGGLRYGRLPNKKKRQGSLFAGGLSHSFAMTATAPVNLISVLRGQYATRLYLPFSTLAKTLRRWSRRIRGKRDAFTQETYLPKMAWVDLARLGMPRVWISGKRNGDVRISEVAILSALAGACENGDSLFEIGTFDGRTTCHLAMNSGPLCQVLTLDLPLGHATQFEVDRRERHLIQKAKSGEWIDKMRAPFPEFMAKVQQLYGDSATFDYSPYWGTCGLVFVDGSHAFDYVKADSATALKLVRKGGCVVWHDYGVWEGVTRALEEIEAEQHLGLRYIKGTSLVYWRKP